MNVLLDTHTVLWLAGNSPELSKAAKQAIFDVDRKKYVCIASTWEVAIKISLGRMRLTGGAAEFLNIIGANGFSMLPVKPEYLMLVESLPFHHRDPFDRLLIATAMSEKLAIVTADARMSAYSVPCAW
jgi:PIN domain nuclease of toxin-antitoxin system